MIRITIASETGYTDFLLTHEGPDKEPSTQLYKNIVALHGFLDELLEKIQNEALKSRLVRNLHAMEDANSHPSVREFARNALVGLGCASPVVQ